MESAEVLFCDCCKDQGSSKAPITVPSTVHAYTTDNAGCDNIHFTAVLHVRALQMHIQKPEELRQDLPEGP